MTFIGRIRISLLIKQITAYYSSSLMNSNIEVRNEDMVNTYI